MTEKRFVTEKEAAAISSLALPTLRNWRHLRKGPPWVVLEKRAIRYPLDELYLFLNARRINPENSENGG
jgi:hypothetical protein